MDWICSAFLVDTVAPRLGTICVRASFKCPTTVVVPISVTLVSGSGCWSRRTDYWFEPLSVLAPTPTASPMTVN